MGFEDFEMDQRSEVQCTACKQETFLNPRMKLLSGPCGHPFCDKCIERTIHQPLRCPICNTSITKKNIGRSVEQSAFNKEMEIRKYISKIYNKGPNDFANPKDYNDYLEDVEDMILKLISGSEEEVAEINKKVQAYKQANQELIVINSSKREREFNELRTRILNEEKEFNENKRLSIEWEKKQMEFKKKERDKLLNDVISGKINPAALKKLQNQPQQPQPTVPEPQKPTSYVPSVQKTVAPATWMIARPVGSTSRMEVVLTDQTKELQKKASGWKDEYVSQRAKEEMLASLFVH